MSSKQYLVFAGQVKDFVIIYSLGFQGWEKCLPRRNVT